jgi:exopolysaccharide biosynthesis polyprenyl glycosylphosphotransferase
MKNDEKKYFTLAIFIGDLLVGLLGLAVGYWLRFRLVVAHFGSPSWPIVYDEGGHSFKDYLGLIMFGSTLLSGTYLAYGLYELKNLLRFKFSVFMIARAILLWLALYLGLSLVLKFDPPISRLYAIGSAFAVFMVSVVWRFVVLRLIRSTRLSYRLAKRVSFLGWSPAADRLAKVLREDPEHAYLFVGYISEDVDLSTQSLPPDLKNIGTLLDIDQVLRCNNIDVLIRADVSTDVDRLIGICNACDRQMVEFKMIPTRFHSMITGLHVENIIDVPVLGVAEGPLERPLNRVAKRIIDIFGAVVGLILSVPIVVVFGVLVYLESPGPILYRQKRVGRHGRTFDILKIRSMRLDAESQGGAQWAKKNDDRRLRVGALMRETNIDEVPQFWNVLRGEMSLVGPRPERPELISRFQFEIPHYNARHSVKPGITGWAQVNGWRGDTDLTERIRYDLYYIEKWTLLGDFVIMLRTVFSRTNAY